MSDKELFVFKGFAGADKKYRRKFTVINELACQNLFIHQLLIRPTKEELDNFGLTDYTILVAPGFHCVSEVIILTQKQLSSLTLQNIQLLL